MFTFFDGYYNDGGNYQNIKSMFQAVKKDELHHPTFSVCDGLVINFYENSFKINGACSACIIDTDDEQVIASVSFNSLDEAIEFFADTNKVLLYFEAKAFDYRKQWQEYCERVKAFASTHTEDETNEQFEEFSDLHKDYYGVRPHCSPYVYFMG